AAGLLVAHGRVRRAGGLAGRGPRPAARLGLAVCLAGGGLLAAARLLSHEGTRRARPGRPPVRTRTPGTRRTGSPGRTCCRCWPRPRPPATAPPPTRSG